LDGFGEADAPELEASLKAALAHSDSVVRGSAASLVGDKKLTALAPDLERVAAPPVSAAAVDAERDARQGALEGLLSLEQAGLDAVKNDLERQARALARGATWTERLRREPSASIRRDLAEKLASTG